MNYSKLIFEYRQKMCLTQVELAEMLHVGVASISRWEQGHFEPTMKVKRKLHILFRNANMEEFK